MMKVTVLDHKRTPHTQRDERLKMQGAPIPQKQIAKMQRMMRQCHEDPKIRARLIAFLKIAS